LFFGCVFKTKNVQGLDIFLLSCFPSEKTITSLNVTATATPTAGRWHSAAQSGL
jgi:hypothetical protein